MPRVCAVVPVYNAESTVVAAVRSILRQSLRDIGVVAVDDGSDDSSSDLLNSMTDSDRRLKVLRVPHGGIIPALNAGIGACDSEFVARMDSDDISHPCRFEMQVDMLNSRPEIAVCSSLVRMFPRLGLLGGMVRYEQWLNSLLDPGEIARDIFVESPVAHPSVMIRRGDLTEAGGYLDNGWAEDYDLWLRLHSEGKGFAKVRSELLYWRQTQGRLTFTDPRYSVENFLRAKARYMARILAGREEREVVLWGAGKTGRRLLKLLGREGVSISAVIDIDPGKIGHTLRGLPIRSPDTIQGPHNSFVIAAVSSHVARRLIRQRLCELGFEEPRDFICAA